MLRSAKWAILLVGLLLHEISVVKGDPSSAHHVADMWFHQGKWTFHVIYTEVGGQQRVDSVLALIAPEAVTGDNLAGVWYLRTQTGWDAKSWDSSSPYDVVKAVKAEVGIHDLYDGHWYLPNADLIGSSISAGVSENYDNGLLASDPLTELTSDQGARDGT